MVNDMVNTLLEVYKVEEIAYRAGVTAGTVTRWAKCKSSPQPEREALIRKMYCDYEKKNNPINTSIDKCLNSLREIFHKTSRFSSRNEALEEISKLFFAHMMSVISEEKGITKQLSYDKQNTARNLKEFVHSEFMKYCQEDNQYDISFELKIKDGENQLAEEIISLFDKELSGLIIKEQIVGTDIINEIFGKFLADSFVDEKQLGQYLTPQEIVNFANELLACDLNIDDIMSDDFGYVLDPSCGVGSFLTAFIDKYSSTIADMKEQSEVIQKLVEEKIVGIDKSERMFKLALINLSMFGYQRMKLYLKNALSIHEIDLQEKVSVIMTNPPFGAEFPVDEISGFKIVSEWLDKKPKKVNSELLFIEKYIEWLKPGGRLLCIVPDSILNNKGIYESLRNGILKEISIRAVISLPSNTFATTGTETKTSLLYFVKEPYDPDKKTYMAICNNNGYDVVSSGAHKTKRYNHESDLALILSDYKNKEECIGQWVSGVNDYSRWDATFHATITKEISAKIESKGLIQIKDVSTLMNERFNPKRMEKNTFFDYIEISDVDANQMRAYGKKVLCDEAPSRARKTVHTNDIIVSTVRPERGIVAVIDEEQDGFVCTTGFAVLKSTTIDPMVLAYLIQSEFVSMQIRKYAMGISYPVIDEKELLEVYLPISKKDMKKYDKVTKQLKEKERELSRLRKEFKDRVQQDIIAM